MATGSLLVLGFVLLTAAVVAAIVAAVLISRANRRREARGFEVQPIPRQSQGQ